VRAALGCPADEALIVAEALPRANVAGHDSHGLIRVEQYAKLVRTGDIVPGAPTTVVREAACTALLDGGWNFGPVVARRALEVAIRKAREYGTGTVSVRNSNHLGRLGEYALMAAAEGMLCIGAVNNHGRGNLVAPFGGSDGRLSTNPITFACPGPERPILVDITTSVVAEGKVRLVKNAGKRVPEGWIIDNQGHPSTDPDDLYTDPRGAILPFGGAVGHKGFALGVMVDILSGALSGAGCSYSSTCRLGNAMFFSVTDIEKFVPLDEFLEQVGVLDRHVKASPPAPGFQEVLMPGEPELRQEELRRREGIRIDEETWRQFVECAGGLGVEVGELDT
jgi:hydroxycarboxylate dehydrogenase B